MTSTKDKVKVKVVALKAFVREVRRELPALFKQYPDGIPYGELSLYYGESWARVKRVCDELIAMGLAQQSIGPNRVKMLQPPDRPPTVNSQLTPIQRQLLTHLQLLSIAQGGQIHTSYAKLLVAVGCSFPAIRTAIKRLQQLNHLHILQQPGRGMVDSMVLQLVSQAPQAPQPTPQAPQAVSIAQENTS